MRELRFRDLCFAPLMPTLACMRHQPGRNHHGPGKHFPGQSFLPPPGSPTCELWQSGLPAAQTVVLAKYRLRQLLHYLAEAEPQFVAINCLWCGRCPTPVATPSVPPTTCQSCPAAHPAEITPPFDPHSCPELDKVPQLSEAPPSRNR